MVAPPHFLALGHRSDNGKLLSLTAAIALLLMTICVQPSSADDGIEFFESRIRPVLIERCYECHNTAETAEGDLALDWRDGIRAKTEHGSVVVPGKPEDSLLMKVIRHDIPDLEMPEGGPKLDAEVVADFRKWIEMGAPDSRSSAPTAEELSEATSWEKTLEKRKQWWSFQPVQSPEIPSGASKHPIDRFIRAKLDERGLSPASKADRRTLIRRAAFALTGLPPTRDMVAKFVQDESEDAFEKLFDHYLSSKHFGERWARHWMDLMRYSDSHGSEGDPTIPHAYRYRDYLIRALNADVAYDQLVREHLAGDLLEEPRINEERGINESALGPAHFRFVFHGFAPTDPLDEKVRFTDDQINVVSKAFLGLTVSCARCHDHKFDAISQADYYAMFGIFASCRPALRDVNLPSRQRTNMQPIAKLKQKLRSELATEWLHATDDVRAQLLNPNKELETQIKEAKKRTQLLHIWKQLTQRDDKDVITAWNELRADWEAQRDYSSQPNNAQQWNLSDPSDYAKWFAFGNGLGASPTPAGEFLLSESDRVIDAIFPAGVVSNTISLRHRAFLASPRFLLDDEYDAWLLVAGDGQPSLRYVMENYPRNGTVYPIKTIGRKEFAWERMKLKYWAGDFTHFEVATSKDAPLQNRNRDKSWFAIRDVLLRKSDSAGPPSVDLEYLTPLFTAHETAPENPEELATRIIDTLRQAIKDWKTDQLDDPQALFLNASVSLLPNSLEALPSAKSTVETIRKLESAIPDPTRAPGIVEADAFDQPLYVRGNHRKPADPVRRRFLEAIDEAPYETKMSGRRELAESILHPDNPLTSRVIANRVWHYLFGKGIVATPDNFGQLGDEPSHPELLDYLANRVRERGWSLKDAIRFVITSETWQADSTATDKAIEHDPENRLLSHANVLRLDAESIRDSLLAVSGQLDDAMFGSGFGANSREKRRSVYVTSRRNSLDEFLKTFDSPTPFATTGRRDVTNVPSQSLTLMNDPFVIELSQAWADSVSEAISESESKSRIRHMINTAFGREPSNDELQSMETYVSRMATEFANERTQRESLEQKLAAATADINELLVPARKRALKDATETGESANGPSPIAAWKFDDDFEDSIGKLHAKAYKGTNLKNNALQLDGDGYAATGPLDRDLTTKTLEAWVQLATLDQSGGGVITVQSTNGVVFDSIVFAEQEPKQWLAGSDSFVRTEPLGGPAEDVASKEVVHVAITYAEDGTIRFYRNGKPYGRETRKSGLHTFSGKKSQVVFGMRHGKVGQDDKGRKLAGQIFEARLYDRALSAAEVLASANGSHYVSEDMLQAQLNDSQREVLAHLREQVKNYKTKLASMPEPRGEREAWGRLGHAIFNLKEFIYLR